MTTFHYNVNNRQIAVQIEPDANGYQLRIGEQRYRVDRQTQDDHTVAFAVDGQPKQIHLAPGVTVDERNLWFQGQTWTVQKVDPRRRQPRGTTQDELGALIATMPGQVQKILVAAGDAVRQGDPLVILEAMKMETRISAPTDGVVTTLNCAVGDVVERGQTLVVINQEHVNLAS